MQKSKNAVASNHPSRRDFLKSSTLVAGGLVAGGLSLGRSVHAAGNDILKVGLIGCGGRGTGAARDALTADPNAKLVAMGDAFADRLVGSLKGLKASDVGERVDVPEDRRFAGFDAYERVLASGVDVVILAEPPHFRPEHLKAAIAAGKHVFCEKPVAVDAPGIRSVLATCEEAKKKNLSVVSGLCWRYDTAVKETMQKVLDGTIGQLVNIEVVYNTGMLGGRDRDSSLTEMQYQMRNWYCFTWLSGDHNVEQHVHSLDKALWAMHDEPPARAWGLGGRQVRVDPRYGDIYDHHAVVYEYANGVRVYSYCRQQNGAWGSVTDNFFGSKARCAVLGGFQVQALDGEVVWRYKGPPAGGRMYVAEHEALFASIRAGKPINNGLYMARSSMLAILGRMVDYTGEVLTWEKAINSQQVLAPKSYAWDAEPPTKPGKDGRYPVAMPGITPFA
jgi:myo-inositol 2-dehydrogenase / D-chiro-inositol 1-dehydrogenase